MAAAQGFTEVYNYSFVSEEQVRAFGLDPAEHVRGGESDRQRSESAASEPAARESCKNICDNAKNFDSFRLFEIGGEIHPDREVPHFAAAIYAKDDGVAGLLELKRLAECLLRGRYGAARRRANLRASAAGGRRRLCRRLRVGRLFEFHPRMVETGRAAVLDLDLTVLESLQPATPTYRALRRFPTSAFDPVGSRAGADAERGYRGSTSCAGGRFAGRNRVFAGV